MKKTIGYAIIKNSPTPQKGKRIADDFNTRYYIYGLEEEAELDLYEDDNEKVIKVEIKEVK